MERFENHQRVKIVAHQGRQAYDGLTGSVVRICRSGAAWVNVDVDIPTSLRVFPADDPRANHVKVYPDECEALA